MEHDYQNRMGDDLITRRKRGRPPKVRPPEGEPAEYESTEADLVVIPGVVLPFVCPWCQRAQTPSVDSTHGNKRYCRCGSCGKGLIYIGAQVQKYHRGV